MISREISNFERGMLVGLPIGAIAGPSIALVIFVLIVCYDLGRPKIVDLGQNLLNKHLGFDLYTNNSAQNHQNAQTPNIIDILQSATDEERSVLLNVLSKSNMTPSPSTPVSNNINISQLLSMIGGNNPIET